MVSRWTGKRSPGKGLHRMGKDQDGSESRCTFIDMDKSFIHTKYINNNNKNKENKEKKKKNEKSWSIWLEIFIRLGAMFALFSFFCYGVFVRGRIAFLKLLTELLFLLLL